MAYAAVVFFLQTLKQLQLPDYQFSNATIIFPRSEIEVSYNKIYSLSSFLEENAWCSEYFESHDLERQIRYAIYEAEDIIDSRIIEHSIASKKESYTSSSIFTRDFQSVIQQIDSIHERIIKFKADHQVKKPHDLDELLPARRRRSFHGKNLMVGRDEDIAQLRDRLKTGSSRLEVVPIVGVSGIGKTAIAKYLYNHSFIMDIFETRVWIKLSLKYRKRDVLMRLLRSMKKLSDKKSPKTDDQLAKDIYNSLKLRKYLIVLDNVSREAWNDLKGLFPDYGKGSRIMLTSKSMDHVGCFGDTIGPPHQLTYLSQDESWHLLHKIVFDGWSRPIVKFIEIGKKIARNCHGLPLAIVILGGLLCTTIMIDWMRIASSIQTCENYVELIKVIVSLSYKYLPQYLRACVLYMGIFPHDYDIPFSTLIKLWIAEGFPEPKESTALEEMAEDYLLQLVDRSFVSVCEWGFGYKIKTCTINDVFLNFIMVRAKEEKIFHIIDENTNGFLEQDTYDHQRLCIHKYLHFGIKDVSKYNTVASISTARSLIYFGPDPKYPLRAWLDFKFVRVLDARNIQFYSFPVQILKLTQLRYLALSYNGELPASICKLTNLQFLIVLRYLNIKLFGAPRYLPLEIWNMKELRHLQVMGSDLPDPTTASRGDGGSVDLLLENLVALVGVSAHSCTPAVLQRIPNLKKLQIQIEPISAENVGETFSFLSHLFFLHRLESLKCIVTHPYFGSQVVPSIPQDLPKSLRKITLSGCGFPWEYMSAIGSLPNLEILKLRCYAFQGYEWNPCEGEFDHLNYLLLEDMDIKYWHADDTHFPRLTCLIIRHCYELQEIPPGIGEIPTLEMIEMVDCSPTLPVLSAKLIKEEQRMLGNEALAVQVHYSWDD